MELVKRHAVAIGMGIVGLYFAGKLSWHLLSLLLAI